MSQSPQPHHQFARDHRASLPATGSPSFSSNSARYSVSQLQSSSTHSGRVSPSPSIGPSNPNAPSAFNGPPLSARRFVSHTNVTGTKSTASSAISHRHSIYSKPILSHHSSTPSSNTARASSTFSLNSSGTSPSADVVGLVAFEFLFAEIVRYTHQRVDGIGEFEKKYG